MPQRGLLYSLLILGTLFVCFSQPVWAASHSILGSEAPNRSFPASELPKWQQILDTQLNETYNTQSANVQKWNDFIGTLKNEPKLRQLMRVNLWFKQFSYKQDNWVYNQDDYWASPVEFLTKGGDCEDYAIIKYMSLKKLGFSADDMKIAMVYDVYSGTDHAFLIVKHEGADFVLDNREKLTVARYMKNRYKPHYAFNENTVWTYNSPVMVQKMRKYSNGTVLPGNR